MQPVPTGRTETLAEQNESNREALSSEARLPQRILVVEDDRDLRRLNTEALTHYGYQVDAAEDGLLAWDRINGQNGQNYDLMITDNRMPNMSGVELLKKMRDTSLSLPTLMATSEVPQSEFQKHPGIEPAAVLCKPYTVLELVEKVRKVLGMREQRSAGALPLRP